jgi:rhamnulose-1-phosphate aldolase/alcohol dehydrogenase
VCSFGYPVRVHGADTIPSRWDDAAVRGASDEELLLYRSNLLGADLCVTNFAGGNTSAKIRSSDPLSGEPVEVLWVKGSGGDLGSMKLDGFATLYQEKLLSLKARYRGIEREDEMVAYLAHCTFALNPRAASIDTPLHAFVPHRHVDHMHPDSVIALAAAKDGERLTHEVFAGKLGWLPWQRPGFDLALKIGALCRARPELEGIVLGGHGLFTWGESSKACYENTLRAIRAAAQYLERAGATPHFGGAARAALEPARRRAFATALLPVLRGKLSREQRKVGHFDDAQDALEFVSSKRMSELAALGTSCPDHFLRTKIRPLVLDCDPERESPDDVARRLDAEIESYRRDYAAYYERCKRADSPPLRDPYPVVVLVPGVGVLTFARDKATARIASEFYTNAIHVMRGATSVSEYVGLDEHEAFGIEYWPLEEAKLKRMPAPKALAGKIALVSGGAGGIGRASAARLLADGCCVMLCDLERAALEEARAELCERFGADQVRAVHCDDTQESSVAAALDAAALEFGGLDILVSNAGIASSAPIEATTLELWERNVAVLATGYFLVSREGFKLFKRQALGGSIVFVGSKNALAASTKAVAYNVAKSAELHLARCLALEGAESGIRVNVVNPDAVLRGSRIWSGEWRKERAQAYGIGEEDLERHYKERSLLKLSVFPEDVAEAIAFFASDRSSKSTGNILNVDAGNLTAFPR